jgi:hypothetical protein
MCQYQKTLSDVHKIQPVYQTLRKANLSPFPYGPINIHFVITRLFCGVRENESGRWLYWQLQRVCAVKRPCWGTVIKGTLHFRPIATYARTSEWFLPFRFFLLIFCMFISLPRFCMCHMYLLGLIISRGQIEYLSRDYLIGWKCRYRRNKPSTVLINSDPDDGDSRLSETSVTP